MREPFSYADIPHTLLREKPPLFPEIGSVIRLRSLSPLMLR